MPRLSEGLENMGREVLEETREEVVFGAVWAVFDRLAHQINANLVIATKLEGGEAGPWDQDFPVCPKGCWVVGPVADAIRDRLEAVVTVDERGAVWAKFILGACAEWPEWWADEVEGLVEDVIMRPDQIKVAQPYECFEYGGVLHHGSEFNGEIFAAKLAAVAAPLAAYAACAEVPTETNIPAVEEALVTLAGAMAGAGQIAVLDRLSDLAREARADIAPA